MTEKHIDLVIIGEIASGLTAAGAPVVLKPFEIIKKCTKKGEFLEWIVQLRRVKCFHTHQERWSRHRSI